jgi:hypothetical protein
MASVMTDWNRWAMIGFFSLAGASVVAALLSGVAVLMRKRDTAPRRPSGNAWGPPLAAFGALVFIGVSIWGELAFLGLVPAGLFGLLALKRPSGSPVAQRDARLLALLAAVAWAGASLSQFAMARWSETVSGAIRVDLVLAAPLLAVATILAVHARRTAHPPGPRQAPR